MRHFMPPTDFVEGNQGRSARAEIKKLEKKILSRRSCPALLGDAEVLHN